MKKLALAAALLTITPSAEAAGLLDIYEEEIRALGFETPLFPIGETLIMTDDSNQDTSAARSTDQLKYKGRSLQSDSDDDGVDEYIYTYEAVAPCKTQDLPKEPKDCSNCGDFSCGDETEN